MKRIQPIKVSKGSSSQNRAFFDVVEVTNELAFILNSI